MKKLIFYVFNCPNKQSNRAYFASLGLKYYLRIRERKIPKEGDWSALAHPSAFLRINNNIILRMEELLRERTLVEATGLYK